MSEENESPPPPPNLDDAIPWKVIWLVAAFLPAVIGICTLDNQAGNAPPWILLGLNAVCSLAASIGLGKGMKEAGSRIVLAICLTPVLFVINIVIVAFVGCSRMGSI